MLSLRIVIFAALLGAAAPALPAENHAPPSAETLAVARELFAVTFDRAGAELNAQAVEHTWPSVENALRARNPGLDTAALATLRRDFERIRLQKLRDLMKDAPAVYARYLSHADMIEIMRFYRSPAGTRLMRVIPALLAEIFAIALPAMPMLVNDTHEEFLKLARDRGYIQ